MTSSFRLVLQVQMWFLFLGGLRKFLALTPLLLLFGSQAQLVVWQDLNSVLSQMFIGLLSGEGILWKVASGHVQRLRIGLENPV